jgi:2,4-didehydro-3-deoxy-L-rhamnonate hydrolase
MKFLRFGAPGMEKPGTLDAQGRIRDLSAIVPDLAGETLASSAMSMLAGVDVEALPLAEGTPRIGPCVGNVGHFIAVGLNYADHAAETGAPIPAEPILFSKAPSSICGPNDDIIYPQGATKVDWEVELGIVIGDRASNVAEADAARHIAGYCICNDLSERAWQMEGTGQWMKGKGARTFGPLGPWLVTPDEVGDPQNLKMTLDVNGERRQDGSTTTMIFGAVFLVSYISRFFVLQPGDVIITGTPPGVALGMKEPRYLKPGDEMVLRIERLGEQRQRVVPYTA